MAENTAKLVFITGSRAGTSVRLGETPSTVGRQSDQTIRFNPDEIVVSAKHASIAREGDKLVLRDVGSTNGTFVNRERITEHVLSQGDLIEFGRGGPSAQFVSDASGALVQTLDFSRATAADLFRTAHERTVERDPEAGQVTRGFATTREFMALAYTRSSKRMRWVVGSLAVITVAGFAAVVTLQQRGRTDLQNRLAQLADVLELEQGSRTLLEKNLASIQSNYDLLLTDVEESRARLEETTLRANAGSGFVESVTREFRSGVALLVFSYGFVQRGSDDLLRFQVDATGQPLMQRAPNGRVVPQIGFAGAGQPLARQGSATGFLIDSAGWIITNRHIAEPWNNEDDLATIRANGLDVEPRFITLEAFFPPGDQSYQLDVHAASRSADVAIMRTRNQAVNAPVLLLGAPDRRVAPGESLVFIGYPTGVHNLMFRLPRDQRAEILNQTGDEPVALARELATRRLITPLVISGAVSDTTSVEIIHTAGTTGGGSGGPLVGASQRVVGIHYAAVRSPIQGDPFQTQRAVQVKFAWELLPAAIRSRLEAN